MIVTLIPLFLGVIIGAREGDWEYGPEAIYNVRIDSVSYPLKEIEKLATFNMSMKLHCRPKSVSSLVCRFNEPNVTIISRKNTEKFDTLGESFVDDVVELKFDGNGIYEIVVSSSINLARLDMIRVIVSQLSIGTDLNVLPKIDFEVMENFTTGTCHTRYDLSVRAVTLNCDGKSYEMIKIPENVRIKGAVNELKRTRKIDKCLNRVDYSFGSREARITKPGNIETKLKSSKSNMIIQESNFTSWTENEIIVSSKLNSSGNTLTERITMSLEKIVAASDPLPTISEPSTVSIFPGIWLNDTYEEEKDSSEE